MSLLLHSGASFLQTGPRQALLFYGPAFARNRRREIARHLRQRTFRTSKTGPVCFQLGSEKTTRRFFQPSLLKSTLPRSIRPHSRQISGASQNGRSVRGLEVVQFAIYPDWGPLAVRQDIFVGPILFRQTRNSFLRGRSLAEARQFWRRSSWFPGPHGTTRLFFCRRRRARWAIVGGSGPAFSARGGRGSFQRRRFSREIVSRTRAGGWQFRHDAKSRPHSASKGRRRSPRHRSGGECRRNRPGDHPLEGQFVFGVDPSRTFFHLVDLFPAIS